MHAIFIEVNSDESQTEAVRDQLFQIVMPRTRAAGAKAAYWLAPHGTHAVGFMIFDSEKDARQVAAQMTPGEPGDVSGITFKAVEVSEVLAALDGARA
jgi:hypothetical protein